MKYFIIVVGIIILLTVLEIYRELHTFKITHYEIETDKFKKNSEEMKLAVLSDLHNCVYGKDNERLLHALRLEKPDMILIAGDMLVGDRKSPVYAAEKFIKEAVKIAPVFYANGNHEQRMKEETEYYGDKYKKYKENLVKEGICFLENESKEINWSEGVVRITGLEIPLSYYKKFTGDMVKLHEIEERIGKSGEERLEILLAHNPVHAASYAKWGADIVLSGHLHGGIVRIPFFRGVITPQVSLFPKYSGGLYKLDDTTLVVSKGLGTHTFPIRLFNVAEAIMLHIKEKR